MVDKNKQKQKLESSIPNYLYKGKLVKYFGNFSIKVAFSKNGKKWKKYKKDILRPREDYFDSFPLSVMGAFQTTEGILLIYDSSDYQKNYVELQVGLAIIASEDPTKVIWRNVVPFYQYKLKTVEKVTPQGARKEEEDLVLIWEVGRSKLLEVKLPHPYLYLENENSRGLLGRVKNFFGVKKYSDNPIIKPEREKEWEAKATFNPAALKSENKIHLLYRAIGNNDLSVLGYAESKDGLNFVKKSKEPVFISKKKIAKKDKKIELPIAYNSGGGGSGGCEDPRLTKIDDTVYLTYTAFDGWGSIRMTLSSIKLRDFLAKEWNWSEPIMISPPGEINKNWVLFPEKINGKFAVIHSINPEVSIEYLEDLAFKGEKKYIKSYFSNDKNKGRWDSWVRGAGPPPIKTAKGWLLFYHAMDVFSDPNRYKIGAMLLDINDPQKVIARSREPVLEPDKHYENEGWKAGVAYTCGAVEKDGKILIYYGGADTVSCVAEVELEDFLEKLIKTERPKIKTSLYKKINN